MTFDPAKDAENLAKHGFTLLDFVGVAADALLTHLPGFCSHCSIPRKTLSQQGFQKFEVSQFSVGTWVNIASAPTPVELTCSTNLRFFDPLPPQQQSHELVHQFPVIRR